MSAPATIAVAALPQAERSHPVADQRDRHREQSEQRRDAGLTSTSSALPFSINAGEYTNMNGTISAGTPPAWPRNATRMPDSPGDAARDVARHRGGRREVRHDAEIEHEQMRSQERDAHFRERGRDQDRADQIGRSRGETGAEQDRGQRGQQQQHDRVSFE